LRLEVSKLFGLFHRAIRRELLSLATHHQLKWEDKRGKQGAMYAGLFSYGQSLTRREGFKSGIRSVASSTSKSVKGQVAKALGLSSVAVDLAEREAAFAEAVAASVEARIAASLERADELYEAWAAGEDGVDVLEERLTTGLSTVEGSALSSTAMLFGSAWAAMNQDTQVAEGVESYIWISQRDPFTRPAHAALDNTVDDWDDPPLKSDASSNGEDCHPGDDFNCRCIAGPIPN